MEEVCCIIAAFWKEQADKYSSQASLMEMNQVEMVEVITDVVVQQNIEFWKEARVEMQRYIKAMTIINNSFNFQTAVTPSATQRVCLKSVGLNFSVPSTVAIGSIEK